jgi:hypothetical protein
VASPPNPTVAPVVTYEYLFFLPLSEQLWPHDRQKARVLLSGSCTPAIAVNWSWPKNLDTTGSL